MQETNVMQINEVFGDSKTRKEVLCEIERDEPSYNMFQTLPTVLQEEMISFCMGNKGLKVTYDPFFKFVFNPSLHPERLSELLSLILEEEVEVVDVLPSESDRVTEEGSLLITDILVRLRDGAYANVEIQKVGYSFPGQRCACYSSDLLIRQLARTKAKAKQENRRFSYSELKKVYTIVFVEDSPAIYWKLQEEYIHRGRQMFNTGLQIDLLQEFVLIPLDIFKNMPHNNISELEAWLYFIGSDEPKDIIRVVNTYPKFKELYKELIGLRYDMKGLIGMFDYYRQLLREADQGTVQYMIEEQKKEIEENKVVIAEQKKELAEKSQELAERSQELAERSRELEDVRNQLEEQKKIIIKLQQDIAYLKNQTI